MGKIPSEHYWEKNKDRYPHQIAVPHLSPQDIDPRRVQKEVDFYFIRVPFHGEAHWGFQSANHLESFKILAGIPQK